MRRGAARGGGAAGEAPPPPRRWPPTPGANSGRRGGLAPARRSQRTFCAFTISWLSSSSLRFFAPSMVGIAISGAARRVATPPPGAAAARPARGDGARRRKTARIVCRGPGEEAGGARSARERGRASSRNSAAPTQQRDGDAGAATSTPSASEACWRPSDRRHVRHRCALVVRRRCRRLAISVRSLEVAAQRREVERAVKARLLQLASRWAARGRSG